MANNTDNNSIRTKLRNLPVLTGPFQAPDFDKLPNTPQEAFEIWLDEAIREGVREPHAMTLSTVDEDGRPHARVLILKDVDSRGWHFAAKADSPKSQQIDNAEASTALTFYWPKVGRQVRIRGVAVPLPEDECVKDFLARPLESRISAAASRQSQVLESREELVRQVNSVEAAMVGRQDLGASEKWKVYAVMPLEVEFWQGSQDRLHHRLRYSVNTGSTWSKDLLWP